MAERHGLAADDLWKILDEPQFYLTGGERETDVSFFMPSFDSAAHSWAQRASEARRELLRAAWMYMHPDRLEPFHWNLDGQAWVMRMAGAGELAVVGVEVTAAEVVEWGAVAVINRSVRQFVALAAEREHRVRPALDAAADHAREVDAEEREAGSGTG